MSKIEGFEMDEQTKNDLLSRVEQCEWIYYFDSNHLKSNSYATKHSDWRIANGLLYLGTDTLQIGSLGCGEAELEVDASVTGADICFWYERSPANVERGLRLKITPDGEISLCEILQNLHPQLKTNQNVDSANVLLKVQVLRRPEYIDAPGMPVEDAFVTVSINGETLTVFSSRFLSRGTILINGGIYKHIRCRCIPFTPRTSHLRGGGRIEYQ